MSSQTNERAFESLIEKALDIKENRGGLSKDVAIFRTSSNTQIVWVHLRSQCVA